MYSNGLQQWEHVFLSDQMTMVVSAAQRLLTRCWFSFLFVFCLESCRKHTKCWYWRLDSNSGNTVVISTPTSATTAILGTDVGSYTFRWTISNGTCTPSTDDVVVTVDNTATTPNAGINQEVCNASSFTLAGNTISTGTGTWSQTSGPIQLQ